MAKTLGYMRAYRARRAAQAGRPVGRALSKAEARDVEVLVQEYGYSRARAIQETRYVNEQLRLQARFERGDLSGIAPRGRAPKGMAEEWRARREIAELLERAEGRADNARARNRSYRGTKAGRYDYSRRTARGDLAPYVQREALAILRGRGSWTEKARAIRGAYEYASAMIE